jgi:hypothetical protein
MGQSIVQKETNNMYSVGARDGRLVRSVQVDENVNGCDDDFGEDQDDDNPFKQFALFLVSLKVELTSLSLLT